MKNKTVISYSIKIQHESFGLILNESFDDETQFKLFLQMTQSSIALESDLTHFDGQKQFFHIPHKHLKNCIITTNLESWDLTDHLKSKLELQKI